MTADAPLLPCQLCGATEATRWLEVPKGRFSSRIGAFALLRCAGCGLATMTPFPGQGDIEELYVEQGVFSADHPNPNRGRLGFEALEPLYGKYGAYYHFIARTAAAHWPGTGSSRRFSGQGNSGGSRGPRPGPRVLDVGCSTGRLLQAFAQVAPHADLCGIDLDPRAAERAPESLRSRIRTGAIEDLEGHERFDIICFCFLVEHLLDFGPPLRRAVELLASGGILFVSTPDLSSPKARQQGADWRLINDPTARIGHLRWFDRSSLQRLGATLGLETERIVRRGELLYHLPSSIQQGLRRLLGTVDSPSGERFIRNYQLRLLWAIGLDGLLSGAVGYGDCLYGFFRKPA